MNQLAKDVAADFRKSLISQILSATGAALWLSAAAATWLGKLLALSEGQLSELRYWLVFAGATGLILAAWSLYIHTLRKLQSVERDLVESRKRPPDFLDDFDNSLVSKIGLWKHKTKGGLYCGKCTPLKKIVAQVRDELPRGWRCTVCSEWFPNPDHHDPPSPEPYHEIGPNDPGFF